MKLIGLMNISGRLQGVFSVQDPVPSKPPTSYILSEDQRQASLEVKSLNLVTQSARVQIGEEVMVLKLEEPKAPTGPAAPAAGMAEGRGQRGFVPGGRFPGRSGLPMPVPGQPAGGAPSGSYSPGVSPEAGNGGLPTRPVRTDANEQPMTAAQQVIAIEQNREAYQQAGSPLAQLLPPTPLTGPLQAQQDAANQSGGNTTAPATAPTTQLPAYLRARVSGNYVPPPPMPGQ